MSQKKRWTSTDINICKDLKQCFFQMAWTTLVGHEINLMCLEQHLKINKIEQMSDYTSCKVVNILSWNIFPIVCMCVCAWGRRTHCTGLQCEYVYIFLIFPNLFFSRLNNSSSLNFPSGLSLIAFCVLIHVNFYIFLFLKF